MAAFARVRRELGFGVGGFRVVGFGVWAFRIVDSNGRSGKWHENPSRCL